MHHVTSESPLQGIIFDFGSTLAIARAPWPAIITEGAAALAGALREAGLALPTDFAELWIATFRFANRQAEQDGFERPAEQTLAALLASQGYPDLPPAIIRQAADRFFAVEDSQRAPASGAVTLLSALRAAGYRLGILSNTITDRWVQHWADAFGFRSQVDVVATSEEMGYRKPRREAFLSTLARMGLDDPRQAVMVGDSPIHDIAGAQALGMRTVRVRLAEDVSFNGLPWPPPEAEAHIRADADITALLELPPILERWQTDGRGSL